MKIRCLRANSKLEIENLFLIKIKYFLTYQKKNIKINKKFCNIDQMIVLKYGLYYYQIIS